ncbi:hypothetical protein LIX60_05105 [Streptomyces sp. S07_1.15]|uniref:hypothetical protein n=1 Tax=Streptomyces sp. S07_1.15 TaxID=2873925 RepID=UPI001D133780|nr:hypothetical protein [Streptomyces sp. S07_1.15]MCC3650864.1 hypothetical protein [Streptomyces sp. S07_1.15]
MPTYHEVVSTGPPILGPGRHAGIRLAWAAGSVLLLTACGVSADGNEARALTGDDIQAVLPDREALPGWQEFGEPLVLEDRAQYKHRACPTEGFRGCEGSRSFGLVQFRSGDDRKTLVGYRITAYRDEQTAATAYDVLWKGHYRRAGGPGARKLDVGKPGDERNARLGTAGSGGPGALVQVRVGTALVVVDVSGIRGGDLGASLVKDLTGVISERAQQALNGEDPAGRLDE